MGRAVDLSVVIPVFGCAPCLEPLYERLRIELDALGSSHEIVFVDDGTRDGSGSILSRLANAHPHVRVHRLADNAGQHAAIVAGLARARGDLVAVMDCDLQHPPEALSRFVTAAQGGVDLVLGVRDADRQPNIRWLASRGFRRTLGSFRRFPNQHAYGTFSVLSRRAVEAYLGHRDAGKGYLMVLDRLELAFTLVDYRHGERHAGRSAYTLPRLVRHAMNSKWNTRRLAAIVAAALALLACAASLGWLLIVGAVVGH